MSQLQLTIPSDYGCLAIIAYDLYHSFVSKNWELEQIKLHIIQQNNEMNIVPWGCVNGNWIVNFEFSESNLHGECEFESYIKTTGKLLLTNYDSITMAAQFEDEKLPQEHETGQVFNLPAGTYLVKVIQNFKTSEQETEKVFNQTEPHYTVSIIKKDKNIEPLKEIPWFSA